MMENRALTRNFEQGRLLVKAANKKPVTPHVDNNIIADSFTRSNQEKGIISNVGGEMATLSPCSWRIINQDLCSIEERFLNQLSYWINHNKYGIKRNNKIWIYNTLQGWARQLNVSISTVRRAIKSLKEQEKIETAYLASNKRNRTLFYTLTDKVNPPEHMDEHMYIEKQNKDNKSNKSEKNFSEKMVPQTTTAQDMLAIWNEILGKEERMSKELARFLVAAMKFKFKTLGIWRKFVQTIKGSTYLIGNKFKLFLRWALKFSSIDRIMNGEFGCRKCDYTDELEKEEREIKELYNVVDSIEILEEEDRFKNIRRQILEKTSVGKYKAWFHNCKIFEIDGKVFLGTHSNFIRDYIQNNFRDIVNQYFEGGVQC